MCMEKENFLILWPECRQRVTRKRGMGQETGRFGASWIQLSRNRSKAGA
jgi:hypothetical protein